MNAIPKILILVSLLFAGLPGQAETRTYDDLFQMILEIDLKQDARLANRQGKHLMIMFIKEGCAPCIKMKNTVLNDPAVQNYYQQNFVSYHVNILGDLPIINVNGERLTEKRYAKRQGIWGTPVFYFYGEGGQLVYKHIGFVKKQNFMKIGQYVSSRGYKALKTANRQGLPKKSSLRDR